MVGIRTKVTPCLILREGIKYGVTLILIIMMACAPAKPVKRDGPAIRLSAKTWSIGTIKRGETVARGLAVTNQGTDTLVISLYSTCDCLRAAAETDTIPPAGQGLIWLSYTGDDIKDKMTRTLFVDSNDDTNPRLTFTVTGRVTPGEVPHLSAIPNPLLFDASDPSYPAAFVTITNKGGQALEITAVRCFGCISEWSQNALSRGEQAVLQIEALPDWPQQRWIEIESNDPVSPVKKIAIIHN